MLRLFANDAPRYLAKVQSANSQREWAEAIHTLKGSARAVGAWAIAECAQAAEMLQRSAREGHDDHHSEPQANSCLKLAIEKLDEVVRSTLAYIDEIAPVPAEGTSIPA